MGMFICYNKGTPEGYEKGCQYIPDNKETKYYLNLTNGIEFLDNMSNNIDYKFIRIQSCSCERHMWDKIIADLDYNFLIDLALGYKVIVFDTSAKKKESRAMYQGLKFVEYVLNRVWFNKKEDIYVKDVNCKSYFEEAYRTISDNTIKKVKYLRKFLNTNQIELKSACITTKHDGDYKYYRKVLIENY